jgi:hypothetical protein
MKRLLIGNIGTLFLLCAIFAASSVRAGSEEGGPKAKESLVHCLLPSHVRKYAADSTRLAPRRVVKVTAVQCQERGGEVVLVDEEE